MRFTKRKLTAITIVILLAISGITTFPLVEQKTNLTAHHADAKVSIPKYEGKIYTVLNDNIPSFTKRQKRRTDAFEKYSGLDSLGRCKKAFANICKELMPTEPRGNISDIHPTGWHSNMGWQRCHLIGFQLAGENANERNLITGTQKFNVSGMLPFENMVDDYVEDTGNHVLYRVTPRFKGNDLVARGVQMEAWSVEDRGDGICFNVFVHNVANGKKINYRTGIVTSTNKQTQNISIGTSRKTLSVSSLNHSKKTFSMGIRCGSGTYSCKKVSGSKYLSVNTKGVVTVKKNTPKGTYTMKVKITAKGNTNYKKKTITKKVRVKISNSGGNNSDDSDPTVYWTPNGEVYHTNRNCSYLSRSRVVNSGKLSECPKPRKCSRCP